MEYLIWVNLLNGLINQLLFRVKLLIITNEQEEKFTKDIWDDTEIIREEIINITSESKNTFKISRNDIKNEVYVPRYYWRQKEEEIKNLATKHDFKLISIKQLIDDGIVQSFNGHGSPPSEFKGTGEIPYIRVADIINWEIYKNPTALIPEHLYLKIKGSNKLSLQKEDILFVRRGSYRIGSVAMVSEFDTKVLLTNEITTFRVVDKNNEYNIDPYYLMFAMSHKITQKQLYNKIFIDTTLPNIGDRWSELLIPVFNQKEKITEVSNKVKATFNQKWEALKGLSKLKEEFGDITT